MMLLQFFVLHVTSIIKHVVIYIHFCNCIIMESIPVTTTLSQLKV